MSTRIDAARYAAAFAALGDATRLSLVAKLGDGRKCSISQLTEGSKMTRQAVTKHLRVLQQAGMVHAVREGRESLFVIDEKPILDLKEYLSLVSEQWNESLSRLKALVESGE